MSMDQGKKAKAVRFDSKESSVYSEESEVSEKKKISVKDMEMQIMNQTNILNQLTSVKPPLHPNSNGVLKAQLVDADQNCFDLVGYGMKSSSGATWKRNTEVSNLSDKSTQKELLKSMLQNNLVLLQKEKTIIHEDFELFK